MQLVENTSMLAEMQQLQWNLPQVLGHGKCQVQMCGLKFPSAARLGLAAVKSHTGSHQFDSFKSQQSNRTFKSSHALPSHICCSTANAPGPPQEAVVGSRKGFDGANTVEHEGSLENLALLETTHGNATQPVAERQLAVAWAAEQGLREEMEDELVVVQDVPGGFIYAGVFDGHAGISAARFLKERLYAECLEALEGGSLLERDLEGDGTASIREALSQAFVQLDSRLLAWQEEQTEEIERNSGSTGTVAFVRRDRIAIAHAGDCRVVMSAGGEAHELCQDHRPSGDSPMALSEIARIKEAGGWVNRGRVCGLLAVSRAFGDSVYKTHRKKWLVEGIKKGRWSKRFVDQRRTEQEWITARPDVYCNRLPDDAEFLLIGSDGLWDSVKSSEAARFVRKQLQEHGDGQQACNDLIRFALDERKGDDNISIVLIHLQS